MCFNGILPDSEGRFLADLIKIPHVAILTESPNGFLDLAKSHYTTTLSPDQQYLDILKQAGCERTLFFPLAAPITVEPVVSLATRKNSILMAPSWVDGETIRNEWKANLPPKMVDLLDEVIFRTLSEPSLSYYHAFQLALAERTAEEQADFRPWTTFSLFNQIEGVIRETDILELLKALKEFEVDLIVQRGTKESWQRRLGEISNKFRFHEGIPFEVLKNHIQQTKIYLASSPQFKFGTTGDLYTSLISGAYTFHNRCEFLEWGFKEGQGAFFYPYMDHKTIQEKAHQILSKPEDFQEEVERGRRLVIENDTWTERAELLLDWLPGVLEELPNQAQHSLQK